VKFLNNIQPRYIVAILVFITLVMFGSSYIEVMQSREELLHVLSEQSYSLAESIERSSANIVLATEEFEEQLSERLLNNAYYIAKLDSLTTLTSKELSGFALANNLYRINIFDKSGRKILSNHVSIHHTGEMTETMSPQEVLKPILDGTESQLIIGLKEARYEEGQRFAVAVRRSRGGAIVLNLDATSLIEFRRRIGIGKLIKDIGDNSGIAYVVLQDQEGIIAATTSVQEISSIADDQLLGQAFQRDSVYSRQIQFQGTEIFEVVKRLEVEGSAIGVLRIGLTLDELHATEARMMRRMLIMTMILIAISALVVIAIVATQNLRLLSHRYERIQSFTGSILKHMRDAVITTDQNGRISVFNDKAEELFGVEASAVLGKQISEIPEPRAGCFTKLFTASDTEISLECPHQGVRILNLSLSVARKKDKAIESQTVVIKDMTETRRMEQEMVRTEQLTAMSELASIVAHEVRNPLNAIAMIAQRFDREFVPKNDAEEYRSLATVLKSEIDRVNRIVQNFLRFARPSPIMITEIPMESFIAHIQTLFEGQAHEKRISFIPECRYNGSVRIDREQMTQALLNVLQNSLQATPGGGRISLVVTKNDAGVTITITDTGAGIPPEQLEKIFDLYYTTKTQGTGIGLAITRQIIHQHNGTISIESTVGTGSILTIRLPQP